MTPRLWLATACLAVLVAACGGKHGSGTVDAVGTTADASHPCGVFGASCPNGGADCCSGICDPQGACAANPSTCSTAGSSCSANTDCCSVSCVNSVCSGTQCTADTAACTTDAECCSGACQNNTCMALNPTCKTDGNPCSTGTDCCSSACNASGHCGPSSYCTQNGDSCAHDTECCGGICTIGAGAALGTCTQPMPGATLCSAGVDGTVCDSCNSCCSRLCEVYAPTGVKICQPAEGCRVNGDLCHTNSDCCGAAGTGLPGDGNVTCAKEHDTDPTGVCRNPMSCNPEGDVCHYKNYNTCGNSSARNDCCDGVGNSGVCTLDALGVPRCYGLGTSCQASGQACSNSLDCCDGAPCVPDGAGHLVCGGTACVPTSGMCTQTADCCSGATCLIAPGQTFGSCGTNGTCQLQGQDCNAATPCCNGVTCRDTTSGNACGATETTGCTCFDPIL